MNFKKVAGGRDVSLGSDDLLVKIPLEPTVDNVTGSVNVYEKLLADDNFYVVNGVLNYGSGGVAVLDGDVTLTADFDIGEVSEDITYFEISSNETLSGHAEIFEFEWEDC